MRLFRRHLVSGLPALLIVVAGCASSESMAPPVTPALVSAAGGASAEKLQEGRRIFAGPCTACHAPDPVSRYSLAEWRVTTEAMAPRAKLTGDQRAALLAYIGAVKSAGSHQ